MSDTQDNKSELIPEVLPEIILPFEKRRFVFGVWIYKRRMGLCVTLIAYLLLAIAMVTFRISIEIKSHPNTIFIDLSNIEISNEIEEEEEEVIQPIEEPQPIESMEFDEIRNLSSNEAIEEIDHSDETQRLLDAAADAERRMAENRANYERGIAEAEAIKAQGEEERRREAEERAAEQEKEDANIDGSVTVSYVIKDPIRHSRRLIVPSYTCQGGGRVVIRVQVNRSGEVINASVHTGGDDCMQEAALRSALASKFDINPDAPTKQSGVIVYIFIPQ